MAAGALIRDCGKPNKMQAPIRNCLRKHCGDTVSEVTNHRVTPAALWIFVPCAKMCKFKREKFLMGVKMSKPPVGLRGRLPFKQKDVVRTMRSAEKGGLTIGHVEVVTKDGVTIRVFGKGSADSPNELDHWIANRDACQA
jgi:hypothetical protein